MSQTIDVLEPLEQRLNLHKSRGRVMNAKSYCAPFGLVISGDEAEAILKRHREIEKHIEELNLKLKSAYKETIKTKSYPLNIKGKPKTGQILLKYFPFLIKQ